MKLTKDQERRVIESIQETKRLIEKEEKYLPHLRNNKLIEEYANHLDKLNKMLTTNNQ
jgi:hypothetical protein